MAESLKLILTNIECYLNFLEFISPVISSEKWF